MRSGFVASHYGYLVRAGSYSNYRSSSAYSNANYAYYLRFDPTGVSPSYNYSFNRFFGFSLRCLQEYTTTTLWLKRPPTRTTELRYNNYMYPDFEQYQITDLDSLYNFCQTIRYGWIDRSGHKHFGVNNSDKYFLQSPAELMHNQIGICWDQTELQRAWFASQGIPHETYFLYYYLSDSNCPSHSILTFTHHGKPSWFEPMFKNTEVYYAGIHSFNSIEELLANLRTKFMRNGQASNYLPKDFHLDNLNLYRYDRPDYGISASEFYDHCRQGDRITIKP